MSSKNTGGKRKEKSSTPKASKTPGTPKTPKSPKPTKEKKAKKVSALDAAAQVLAASSEPLNTTALIEQMAAKKLWTSPGGKTPAATLNAAIIREIAAKKGEARFKKMGRGLFLTREAKAD